MTINDIFEDWHKDEKMLVLIRSKAIKKQYVYGFDYWNFYKRDLEKTKSKTQSVYNTMAEYGIGIKAVYNARKIFEL